MRRRARPSLRSTRVTPADSISPSPVAHGRLAAESAGATQLAHRGGGIGTPRAGAARAAHHAAGAVGPVGEQARLLARG
jgi:hypothetical protein